MKLLKSIFGKNSNIIQNLDFQVLLIASILPLLGTAIVSPILSSLIRPLATTSESIGLMISFFAAPPIVMIPISGFLADYYNRKWVLFTSIIIFGISGTAIAFTTDFSTILGLRFLQGIGFSGIHPIIITRIGDLYSGEVEVAGQGIRILISSFSAAILPIVAGLIVVVQWSYPFLLYFISIPIGIAVVFWLDEENGPSRAATSIDRDWISYINSIIRLVKKRQVLAMLVARALMPVIWISFLTYNSIIVIRLLDGTSLQAGVLAATGFFLLGLTASQAGRIMKILNGRKYSIILANIFLTSGFIVFIFASGFLTALLGISIVSIGFGVVSPMYRSIITDLAPENQRASLVSLSEAGGRLTTTLTPLAMGGVIGITSPVMGFGNAVKAAGILMSFAGIISILIISFASLSSQIRPP